MKKFLLSVFAFAALVVVALAGFAATIAGCVIGALCYAWWQDGGVRGEEVRIVKTAAMVMLASGALAVAAFKFNHRITRGRASSFRLTRSKAEAGEQLPGWVGIAIWMSGLILWLWGHCRSGDAWTRGFEMGGAILLLAAGMFARILLHELGHLAAASLLGLRLLRIQIGSGKCIWRHRFASGFLWEWRMWPAGGLMAAIQCDQRGFKWRQFAFVFGGVIVDVWLIWIVYALVVRPVGGWFAISGQNGIRAAMFLIVWYLVLTAASGVIPQKICLDGQRLQSDGSWLFGVWRMSPAAINTAIMQQAAYGVNALLENDQIAQAWLVLREAATVQPNENFLLPAMEGALRRHEKNFLAASRRFESALNHPTTPQPLRSYFGLEAAACLSKGKDAPSALAWCEEMLAKTPAEERVQFLDAFACLPLMHDCSALLPFAQRCCAEALQLAPELLTLHGTRGALFVEQCQFSEGEPYLRRLLRGSKSARDRGIASYYLSLIADQREPRTRASRRLRARAARLCPEKWLLNRIGAQPFLPLQTHSS